MGNRNNLDPRFDIRTILRCPRITQMLEISHIKLEKVIIPEMDYISFLSLNRSALKEVQINVNIIDTLHILDNSECIPINDVWN